MEETNRELHVQLAEAQKQAQRLRALADMAEIRI